MDIDIDIDEPVEDAPPREAPPGSLVSPGSTVGGRFHVKGFIGRGLLGEVYRAIDAKNERTVALRLLPHGLFDAPRLERLRQEIQRAATLKQKNIAAPFGMGEEGEFTFVTSEYVDGQSLRSLMAHKGTSGKAFSLKGAYNVVAHTCNALVEAHKTVVHGVLSPGNVLVNRAGRVKLTDFGFVRVVADLPAFRERLAGGRLYFVAPELAATPQAADRRADVFSVGALLYELLTGREPAVGGPLVSKLRPDLPKEIDKVVERCMRQRPEDRFPDATELKAALLAAVEAKPAPAQAAAPAAAAPAKRVPFGGGLAAGTQPGVGSQPGKAPIPLGTIPGVGPAGPAPAGPAPLSTQPGIALAAAKAAGLPEPAPPAELVDENDERWLVQKDRLDFGPYSLIEVRRRIENAEFLGDHFIVDQQTGMRRRIRDLPALRDFVREGEVRREQIRREAADTVHKNQERRRFGMLALIVVGVLALGGGGVTYVVVYRQTPVNTTEIKIVDKGEGLDRDMQTLLAGIQISSSIEEGKKKRRGGGRRGGRGAGGGGAEGPDVINLGDVSKDGGDEQASPEDINNTMRSNFRSLAACMLDARRRDAGLRKVDIAFDVHGDGSARNIRVNGSSGDALTGCISGRMAGFRFPRYTGPKTRARWDMRMN
jgi:eukaryotic-like serine/threonine-protein kinase